MTLSPRPSDSELLERVKQQAQREARKLLDRGGPSGFFAPIVPGPNAIVSAIADAKPTRARPVDKELPEQIALFTHIDTQTDYPELKQAYAVPNGGRRSKAVAGKMRASGVRAGELDINLDLARGGFFGLRLELKAEDGSVSVEQKGRILEHKANNYATEVVVGWEHAYRIMVAYVQLPKTEVVMPYSFFARDGGV